MSKDEIKKKIQLKTINLNKIIEKKKIELKEKKNKLMGWCEFLYGQHVI